jgi:hypothetical protein
MKIFLFGHKITNGVNSVVLLKNQKFEVQQILNITTKNIYICK